MIGGPRWRCSRVVGCWTVCDSASRGTCDEAEPDKTATECNSTREQHITVLICISSAGCTRPSHHIKSPRSSTGNASGTRHGPSRLATARLHTNPTLDVFLPCTSCAAEAAGNISNRWSGEGHEWRREAADWPGQPPAVFVLSCHAREPESHHGHHRASSASYASEAHPKVRLSMTSQSHRRIEPLVVGGVVRAVFCSLPSACQRGAGEMDGPKGSCARLPQKVFSTTPGIPTCQRQHGALASASASSRG
jgi:hypothetical protein